MSLIHKQVLYKALKEPIFAKEIFYRLPLTTFEDNKSYKKIASIINSYYRVNNTYLDETTLQTLVEDNMVKFKESLETQNEMGKAVHELYEIEDYDQNDEVVSESLQKFIRKTLTAEMMMDVIQKGNLEDEETLNNLSERIKEISILNVNGNNGGVLDFFEDTERKKELLKNMQESKIPTGFKTIDYIADGGLAKGEMGLVIAPTGGGKTMWAVNQASNYVKSGYNVLYVPLEENLDRMTFRLEHTISQQSKKKYMPNGNLNEPLFDAIQQAYNKSDSFGSLYVAEGLKPQQVTPSILEQIIVDNTIRKGKQIDVVIVDYPDLMKNPYDKLSVNESRAGGMLYEALRSIAKEYDLVMWALSQINRTGFGQDIKTAASIEGSKQKLNACELVFTLNQTPEEFAEGFIRIYLDKVRNHSGQAYEKIQQFKVIPETGTIRDETEEEKMAHTALLSSLENNIDSFRKAEKAKKAVVSKEEATVNMNNMNNALLGNGGQ